MSDAFWTTVFAIGVVQGSFLFVALLLRPSTNRRATRALAAIVAVFTLMILGGIFGQALAERLAQLASFLNINTELAIGPLFLLFVRSILDPDRRWSRRDGFHFLPLILGLLAWSTAWATLGDRPGQTVFRDLQVIVPAYVAFKACFLFAYLAMTYRTLDRGLREPLRFAVGRRPVGLHWLKPWLLGLGGMAGLSYLVYFVEISGVRLPFEPDSFASLILAGMIYLASLLVLLRPWVLSLKPRPVEATRWAREAARLTSYLERERPWLEPELGLSDLATALGSTENRLSAVINEGLDTSFYGLVNRYRLAELDRLVRDPAVRDRPVLDLAFEAGFNSKASFYRIFRQAYGTTPTAYRDAL